MKIKHEMVYWVCVILISVILGFSGNIQFIGVFFTFALGISFILDGLLITTEKKYIRVFFMITGVTLTTLGVIGLVKQLL